MSGFRVFGLLFCFSSVWIFSPLLLAQELFLVDLAAPKITLVSSSVSVLIGGSKKISARVTDNVGVQSVTLFYRTIGENLYQSVLMAREREDFDSYFRVVSNVKSPGIEYYVEAIDLTGNTLSKGKASPFMIRIKSSYNAPHQVSSIPSTQDIRDNLKESLSFDNETWMWIGLGALAVGGLIAAGGDSGGGCTTPTGSIIISAPLP